MVNKFNSILKLDFSNHYVLKFSQQIAKLYGREDRVINGERVTVSCDIMGEKKNRKRENNGWTKCNSNLRPKWEGGVRVHGRL